MPGAAQVTFVVYHYVRPLAGSAFPAIRGLEASAFEGQLDYLTRHYQVVPPAAVVEAISGRAALPPRAAVLTFDDGYTDHIRHVFPALRARGLSGAFFAPTEAVFDRAMLDVNRIHHVLASVPDAERLVTDIEAGINEARGEFDLRSLADYRRELHVPYHFDTADVGYVKRLLQHALPEPLRARIARAMFARHVTADERAFADELYMSTADLLTLADAGMLVGSHGHRHLWLGRLDREAQADDIDRSLGALNSIGLAGAGFWFCYPYGSHNEDTVSLLADRGCAAAVTTVEGLADCAAGRPYELPRLDTNVFPRTADAPLADWTRRATPTGAAVMEDAR